MEGAIAYDDGHTNEYWDAHDAMAVRVQSVARRMLARRQIHRLRALWDRKAQVLSSLRGMYSEVWDFPEHVPESRMNRLIERDVFDTHSEGAPTLSEVPVK